MRYYRVYRPGARDRGYDNYTFCTRLKDLHDLPEGTEVFATITDRNGHETDRWPIPVVNGRPRAGGRTLYGKGTIRQRGPRAGTVR